MDQKKTKSKSIITVGLQVGTNEGEVDGVVVGTNVGKIVGLRVGVRVGIKLGQQLGTWVGKLEGIVVGTWEGVTVGLRDGKFWKWNDFFEPTIVKNSNYWFLWKIILLKMNWNLLQRFNFMALLSLIQVFSKP